MPIVVVHRRTPEQLALFASDMAQLNPNGFRTPGRSGTSLVEQLFLRSDPDYHKSLRRTPGLRAQLLRRGRAKSLANMRAQQAAGMESRANRRELRRAGKK